MRAEARSMPFTKDPAWLVGDTFYNQIGADPIFFSAQQIARLVQHALAFTVCSILSAIDGLGVDERFKTAVFSVLQTDVVSSQM